jgi:hypothetical protein
MDAEMRGRDLDEIDIWCGEGGNSVCTMHIVNVRDGRKQYHAGTMSSSHLYLGDML